MTTSSINLSSRIPSGPIRVQRPDKTCYVEASQSEIHRLIESGIVEGVGPRSGRIDILRITVSEDEAVERLAKVTKQQIVQEKPGSIIGDASREVYRETLGESGHWVWTHKTKPNLVKHNYRKRKVQTILGRRKQPLSTTMPRIPHTN